VSTTTNYGWTKPTVGGDADTWGTELNGTLDDIDGQVKANEGAIILASGPITQAATFLTLDLTSYLSDYKRFEIKLNRVNCGSSSTSIAIRFSVNGGSTWLASAYTWALAVLGAAYAQQTDTSTGVTTEQRIQSGAGYTHGTVELSILNQTHIASMISSGTFSPTSCIGAGGNTNSGINAIKFYSNGGSATGGTYDLVGYR